MSSDISDSANLKQKINPVVFFASSVLILTIILYTLQFKEEANRFYQGIQAAIMNNGSWFYVFTVAVVLIGTVYIGLSRYGDIKLGPDHSEPDYSFRSWFAMLFSAGIGIGLMFFGVGEPVKHLLLPPVGEPETVEAAKQAMSITFFHWGLHAWSIYAIVALILAYFGFRHDLPLTLRSSLYPFIGDRIHGVAGHLVDIFAILSTTFGVATALGFGVSQVNAGINYLFDIEISTKIQTLLIVGITALATLSVASGLDRGIRILSEINLLLAVLLMVLITIFGPTVLLFQMFIQNTGSYLSEIVTKTFNMYAYQPTDWLGGWTLFYWAWWLSWSPFVGTFIARISKGRTIREFIFSVLFVPSLLTFLWMTVFGNASIDLIMTRHQEGLSKVVQQDVSLALFKFLEYFPFSGFLSGLAVVMIVIFFVTSSDSSAMVIDMLASRGKGKPVIWRRVFWSILIGLVALVLMLAGGLSALQTATIATALPFSILLLLAGYGLLKALQLDYAKKASLSMVHLTPKVGKAPIPWQRRLDNIVQLPTGDDVTDFFDNVVLSAMQSVAEELLKKNVDACIYSDIESHYLSFEVFHGEEMDFLYQVRTGVYLQPSFMIDDEDDERKYARAEVFLQEGGQDYDIMGWTKEQVIGDIIDQYEKHMHYLHTVR